MKKEMENYFLKVIKEDSHLIENIEHPTKKLIKEAIRINETNLENIEKKYLTKELVIFALKTSIRKKRNFYTFNVNRINSFLNNEDIFYFVKKGILELGHPIRKKEYEKLVNANMDYFPYLSEAQQKKYSKKYPDFVFKYLKKNPNYLFYFSYLKSKISKKIIEEIMSKKTFNNFSSIPEEFLTEEIYKKAIKKVEKGSCGQATLFSFLKKHYRYGINYAFRNNVSLLCFIPKNLFTLKDIRKYFLSGIIFKNNNRTTFNFMTIVFKELQEKNNWTKEKDIEFLIEMKKK
jgi:hypothetical protein